MRSILVIGLGRFGRTLALKLAELDNEVMVIDIAEDVVTKIAPYVSEAQIGDCMDEIVLRDIDVKSFDICFVCTSSNLETSLVITALLRELGAKKIVTKVSQDIHQKILLRNGADDVIYPERDIALRTAMKYTAKEAFDYVELSTNYGIFEIAPPKAWIGHTISEISVRKNYHVNIIAYKSVDEIIPLDREEYTFNPEQHLIVAGDRNSFGELLAKMVKHGDRS